MADYGHYPHNAGEINQENSDNWQRLGVVAARLIGGRK